jgi:uncharacterized protein
MKCDTNLSSPQSRITVLDALRGFTLLGIMLTHMMGHFDNSPSFGMEDVEYMFPALDAVIKRFVQIVISGKFFIIFSFLFGLGFFIHWLKYFLYGPLEWFWRTATYLKWQPMRKTNK